MAKAANIFLIAVIAAGVVVDPYSWNASASDAVVAPSVWQPIMAVLALMLLVGSAACVWRERGPIAARLVVLEALLSLMVAAALVRRDGVSRFVRGIGAEEYLSIFLVLVAMRVLLLYNLTRDAAQLRATSGSPTSMA